MEVFFLWVELVKSDNYKEMNAEVNRPEISVCMPFYNAGSYLKESIASVLKQTFRSFELILVNDGSTDDSLQQLEAFGDSRIRYISCPHDFIHSLNTGLEAALGKYIARMDADDLMLPDRLQIQYDFMESHSDIVLCGTGMEYFGLDSGRYIPPVQTPEELAVQLVLSCPLAHPTWMMRRSIVEQYGIRYRADYIYAEDFKFCADLVRYGRLINIPQVLLKYRVSDSQICNRHAAEQASLSRIIRRELTEYYLSLLSVDTSLGVDIRESLLPVLETLNEQAFFSPDEYFSWMHGLIRGLVSRQMIRLENSWDR